jgi:hypothetical protein
VADSSNDKPVSQYPKPKSDAQKAADDKRANDLLQKAEQKAPTKDPDAPKFKRGGKIDGIAQRGHTRGKVR